MKNYIFDKDDNQDFQSKLAATALLIVLTTNFTVYFGILTAITWGH